MIGRTIIELDSVDSTNEYSKRLHSSSDFEDGTVIHAREQFAGRGQHDHTWISEPGKNLTCTVCLKPRFLNPGRQFQLNKAITLGILDFIQFMLNPASRIPHPASCIKWPNDIYAGNQKIGGILIENRIMGSVLETSFAGIGININQEAFAPDIPNPVSLIHFLGQETDLKDALQSVCRFLDRRYQELPRDGNDGFDSEFDGNLMGFGQWRDFLSNGSLMEGMVRGVDYSGQLMVETREGKILRYGHHEIEYVIC